jgi:hypothetical protein
LIERCIKTARSTITQSVQPEAARHTENFRILTNYHNATRSENWHNGFQYIEEHVKAQRRPFLNGEHFG